MTHPSQLDILSVRQFAGVAYTQSAGDDVFDILGDQWIDTVGWGNVIFVFGMGAVTGRYFKFRADYSNDGSTVHGEVPNFEVVLDNRAVPTNEHPDQIVYPELQPCHVVVNVNSLPARYIRLKCAFRGAASALMAVTALLQNRENTGPSAPLISADSLLPSPYLRYNSESIA